MKIAVCQLQIEWENKEKTMEKVLSFLAEAKDQEADIIFFPEMTLTGFSMEVDKTRDCYYGETIERFQKCCERVGIAAGFGWVEREDGKMAKNHYSIVNKQGTLISDYIKVHPFGYGGEGKFFTGGSEISSCKMKEHVISTAICYDLRFPELFRIMDEQSSIVVVPANWPEVRSPQWKCLLQARAIENQVYVIGVNCYGDMMNTYYSGDSAVYNPLGEKMASISNREGIICVEIENDVPQYREAFPARRDRKISIQKLEKRKCKQNVVIE